MFFKTKYSITTKFANVKEWKISKFNCRQSVEHKSRTCFTNNRKSERKNNKSAQVPLLPFHCINLLFSKEKYTQK